MNAIDGTDRHVHEEQAPPPSLLAIVVDTNPHAWAHLSSSLPLSAAISALLVFINAHLASGTANGVAVIAAHSHRAAWLYPTPKGAAPSSRNGTANGEQGVNGEAGRGKKTAVPENPNKYRPFALVEDAITSNLTSLLEETIPQHLLSTPTTLIGGALSLALTHISKLTTMLSPNTTNDSTSSLTDLSSLADASTSSTTTVQRSPLTSRILILSVSGDLASQYIPVMNSIFAAQRKNIPIDILKLAGDTVLLQQASDATGGVYIKPERPEGILQYLMMGFLADGTARRSLVMPGKGGVDFRAACFCHRKVVDVGFVCSVCLSSKSTSLSFCFSQLYVVVCLTVYSILRTQLTG
jgi:transcription initiation factor TFIIH subunit 3